MRRLLCGTLFAAAWGLAGPALADVPTQVQFQGRIELPESELKADDEGERAGDRGELRPFTGTGRFKFAIVSDTGAALWTNVPGNLEVPPPGAVLLSVQDGVFNVALGDPRLGMPPILPDMFAQADRQLRVFFQAEVRGEKGRLRRTTPERELLPPQRLLTTPFAFKAATVQSIDKQVLSQGLAGATVPGSLGIAENVTVAGSALVKGDLRSTTASIGKGTIHLGPSAPDAADNTISFSSSGALNTTGGALTVDAAGGVRLNGLSTGAVTMGAGGGKVGVGTEAPSFKLHVASGAGEAGDILVVSTGTSNVFRVNGLGEVRASRYFGDGSGLSGVSAAQPVMPNATTVTFTPATTFNITGTTPVGVLSVPITFPPSSPSGAFRVLAYWNLMTPNLSFTTGGTTIEGDVSDGANVFARTVAGEFNSDPTAIHGSGVSPVTYAPGTNATFRLRVILGQAGSTLLLGVPSTSGATYLTVQIVPW